jgi:hypothetical protein
MVRFIPFRTALAIGAALFAVGPAAAQYYPASGWYRGGPVVGYTVRASGIYGGPVLPAGPGGFEYYYPGRPIVTVADPWGRVADVPLRPKVLYYSDQFLTPHGTFYPRSVTVIPDDRRPRTTSSSPPPTYYTPPASSREEIPAPKAQRPAAREGAPPPKAQPPSEGLPPLPPLPGQPAKSAPPNLPIPKASNPDRPAGPALPTVPDLPRLPDVPAVPGGAKPAGDKVPNLGPAPLDTAPPPRPGK